MNEIITPIEKLGGVQVKNLFLIPYPQEQHGKHY